MSTVFTTQVIPQQGAIDFGIGQPDLDILPLDILQQASAHRFANGSADMLNYGYELGDGYFRQALADVLGPKYGKPVDPNALFCTGGASSAIDLICTCFTSAGDTVLVEDPTYFLVFDIFKDHGLNVVGVPFATDGYDFDGLERAIKTHKPALFYTIPTFQNPSTRTIPQPHRERLVALAEQHGFLIVADEVYQLLDYSETPPPPYANLTDSDRVLSVGTFSKILAPGLRLGWIQAHPAQVAQLGNLGMVVSGGGVNHLMSNIVTSALELGLLDDYLARLKPIYSQRIDLMDRLLGEHFGDRADQVYQKPGGGFFFWLTLGDGIDTKKLLRKAQSLKTGFGPGVNFSINNHFQNCLRLSFAYFDDREISEGMGRLLACISPDL